MNPEDADSDRLHRHYKNASDAIAECSKHSPSRQEEMIKVVGSSYRLDSFDKYWHAVGCSDPTDHHICYGGVFSYKTCSNHLCYNIHDKSHCPGYTDRVFFGELGEVANKSITKLKSKFYNSLEHISTGDHTPVISMFTIQVDQTASKNVVWPTGRPPIDDRAWILAIQAWKRKTIIWPNGSGLRCFRKGLGRGILADTGCPKEESCFEVENKDQSELEAMGAKVQWTDSMPVPRAAGQKKCAKNRGNTFGICATNREKIDCRSEIIL